MGSQLREKDLLAEIDRLKKLVAELKTSKPYGLVWEDKPEQFEKDAANAVPVLKPKGGKFKDINLDPNADHNVLIEGDNYHALSVLSYTHRGKIDVIYIDPPYNTGSTDWKYNNDYVDYDDAFKHSKWLSFMDKRLRLARDLLNDTGVLICTIDHNEQENLGILLRQLFASYEIVCVTIVHNPAGIQGTNFSYTHEYAYFIFPRGDRFIAQQIRDDGDPDVRNFRDVTGATSLRQAGANCFYPIYIREGVITGFGDVLASALHPTGVNELQADGTIAIWPIDPQNVERKWRYARNTVEAIKDELAPVLIRGRNIWDIKRTKRTFNYKTVWTNPTHSSNNYGTQLLNQIIEPGAFSFPKSLPAVRDCLTAALNEKTTATILDFFAGSGTTAHAVLELNKQDGGNRRFILTTNNENNICEDVTFERVKLVMKGYTSPVGDKIDGLGGNLTYMKTHFIPKDLAVGLSDEAKLKLTHRANLLLSLKENTFTPIEATDHYEITASPTKITAVYFREDKVELETMLNKLLKIARTKPATVYIFAWEKGAYKTGIPGYPFDFQDIPEPIVEVYQSIGY